MVYWVVSVPLVESQGHTRNLLQSKLKFQNLADVSSINLPTLKIGTLDSLLGLSDDLVKINGEKRTLGPPPAPSRPFDRTGAPAEVVVGRLKALAVTRDARRQRGTRTA